eukprot:tig00020553_g10596.t1
MRGHGPPSSGTTSQHSIVCLARHATSRPASRTVRASPAPRLENLRGRSAAGVTSAIRSPKLARAPGPALPRRSALTAPRAPRPAAPGYNHLTCSGCLTEFCWACGDLWCYDQKVLHLCKRETATGRTSAMAHYLHMYRRYLFHSNNLRRERSLLQRLRAVDMSDAEAQEVARACGCGARSCPAADPDAARRRPADPPTAAAPSSAAPPQPSSSWHVLKCGYVAFFHCTASPTKRELATLICDLEKSVAELSHALEASLEQQSVTGAGKCFAALLERCGAQADSLAEWSPAPAPAAGPAAGPAPAAPGGFGIAPAAAGPRRDWSDSDDSEEEDASCSSRSGRPRPLGPALPAALAAGAFAVA